MKYDDASWHYGGDFPVTLPTDAGGTHIGMFVGWAVLNGLAGAIHLNDYADDLARLSQRRTTPGAWFMTSCDEKFVDEDLNEEGNRFALAYFADLDGSKAAGGLYLDDYQQAFPRFETLYAVPDSWASFDTLAPIIQSRLDFWRSAQSGS